MEKRWIFAFTAVIAVMAVFAYASYVGAPAEKQQSPQLANPASVYCKDNGYELEIRTAEDGAQTGYCIFPSGKECEEWAFYRGECSP